MTIKIYSLTTKYLILISSCNFLPTETRNSMNMAVTVENWRAQRGLEAWAHPFAPWTDFDLDGMQEHEQHSQVPSVASEGPEPAATIVH